MPKTFTTACVFKIYNSDLSGSSSLWSLDKRTEYIKNCRIKDLSQLPKSRVPKAKI